MLDAPTKPPVSRARRVADAAPALLDATLLKDELAIEDALRALESHLVDPAILVEEVIAELSSVTHCLEFVLSAVSDPAHNLLCHAILRQYPNTPDQFISSRAAELLSRFSLSLFFLPYPDASAEPPNLRKYRQRVETAVPALKALSKLRFSDSPTVEETQAGDLDGLADAFLAVKTKGKRKIKQSKRTNRAPPVDTKVFLASGTWIPTTNEAAVEVGAHILEGQKGILQEYLDLLRLSNVAPLVKTMYIPRQSTGANLADPTLQPADLSIASHAEGSKTPAAYPLVQPMKAALYFDSVVGFGEWRILISTRGDRDLRQARNKNPQTFRIIVKKIKELSRGQFSDDNQKRLTGLNVDIPIYEAKMTGDTRLVYQVDCIPEFESDVERQVLKIFGIYTHAQLDRGFWDCMSRQLERKGAEYKKRCMFRNKPKVPGDYVVLPASWPPPTEPVALEPTSALSDLRKEDLEELHSLLVLEKFVTFSQALLNSMLANQDVAHVFDVSPHEKKIIEHPSSCYVLGRSGTGKTTTMLFKMLGIERSWESYRETMPKPRQLFVTQSRVLAEKVEEYFAKLLESLATANQSPKELANLATRKKDQQQQGLVDRDEEIYWRGDLPKRYGALKEEHFPMFLTYDHICRLLEAEFHYSDFEKRKAVAVSKAMKDVLELRDPEAPDGTLSNDYMQQRRASFVSFGTFLEEYWSHFPQTLTKGLDPTLVFGEFMGVIKGSEQALGHSEGYLDQITYCKLSHRMQATFATQRDNIYKLFQAYLKRKKERGDYDAADRTHALINCLKTMGVPGQEVDFMYVDEAQDNLLIDAVVLRTLCRNPHGMFWAGDTAQTISVGSAFRFNDLKAFLYRYEEATTGGDANKRTQPESFHLAVNYRSHAGIVDCAYSVIQLITDFWPHAIDALGQETGMIGGLKPVFFSGWDQNTVRYEQFLFGESGSHIEFGAQQCILVRDEGARERLRAQVGDIGLILTLYESKGLEFNDVLLFNFFEDSTVDLSQWRVVLNALSTDQRADHPAPRFDDARHSGVCRELKFLYVAITRARKNLWIADCSEKGEPMRILWTQKDLIENCDPGTDVPRLAMSSTEEDWAKMALELFNNRRYMQAMHCYERAGLAREKAVANAYYLREVARSTSVSKSDAAARTIAYITAAEAFCASAQQAVTEKRAYYRIAAECYIQCGDDHKGAQAYLNAAEYKLAAQHFRKAGKFDEAVQVVQGHRDNIEENVANSIVDVSRLYYLRENSIKKARGLCDSDEELLEYMDDYGLDVVRASFLEQLGRYGDAADVHLSEGNTLEAIRLLTLDRDNTDSIKKATQSLLDGLWSRLPCGTTVTEELLQNEETLARLLRLSNSLSGLNTDGDLHDEISMFRAIAKRDLEGLDTLGKSFSSRGNLAAAFLCFDHFFSVPLKIHTASLSEVSNKLQTFFEYANILHKFGTDTQVCDNETVRKVFAIQSSNEDLYILPKDSFLGLQATPRLTPSARLTDLGISVPRWELERLLRRVLNKILVHRVKEENRTLRGLRRLQPCLTYAVYHQCNRVQCPRHHDDFEHYSPTDYTARIRVIMQQIMIYQGVRAVEDSREQIDQRLYWLEQLYDALFPAYYKLGSFHDLDRSMIPELARGLQVAQVWIRDLLYSLDPYGRIAKGGTVFLTVLMRMIRLSLTCDFKAATEYLPRVPCVAGSRPPQLLRNPEKAYIVHDLLGMMHGSEPNVLNRGILFVNHVLDNKLSIDIGVLCNFMETLCGSLLIPLRLRKRGSLHDLTLPKSWIMRVVPHVDTLQARDTQLSFVFKKHAGELLEQIYSGAAWLLHDGRDLQTLGFPVRNIFFARICTMFCLWGYNMSNFGLQQDIHRSITMVRKPGRTFHPLIEKYVNARSWDALSRVVRGAVAGTAMDEMIQLHHGPIPVPKWTLPNVRRVIFNRTEDIPWLLKTGGSSAPLAGLRAEAAPFVPTRASAETIQETRDDADDAHEDGRLEDMAEDDIEQAVDMDNIAQAIDAEQANSAPIAPTAEEVAAARTFAEAYRKHLAQVSLRKTTAKEEKRRRVFTTFAKAAQSMDWPHTYYRLLFLGPIPHLFIVADAMKGHLYEAKSKAKKRINIVKHLELENVQSTLTQTIQLIKEAERLYKALGHGAEVHTARDVKALEEYTLQVEALLRSLPSSVWDKCGHDMKIALRGIVEKKKPPKHKPKPELNVVDDSDAVAMDLDDFSEEEQYAMDVDSS